MHNPSNHSFDFSLYDPIPCGICVISSSFEVLYWNRCIEDWTGIFRKDIIGQPLEKFFPDWKEEHYQRRMSTLFEGGPPVLFSPQLHPNLFCPNETHQRIFTITATHLSVLGSPHSAVITIQDISDLNSRIKDLRLVESQLRHAAEDQLMMMRESHHRIKNNLTMISGLIILQQSRVEDQATIQILEDLQQRIFAITQIHDLLHRSTSLTINSTVEYLDPLAKTLTHNLSEKGKITLQIEIDPTICLDTDKTIALGIIQTELITNALKYAFPRQKIGVLKIHLYKDDNFLVYNLSQSGDTLPQAFSEREATGLGMLLLTSFVKQLKGVSQWTKADPTVFNLRFPT